MARSFFATFPQLEEVRFSHAWSGPIALSTRMAVQFQRYHDGKAIWVGGYSGFGISASRFGARAALALLDNSNSPELELYCVRTLPNRIPPEPFRWIGAKLTMYALDDVYEKAAGSKAWINFVHRLGVSVMDIRLVTRVKGDFRLM